MISNQTSSQLVSQKIGCLPAFTFSHGALNTQLSSEHFGVMLTCFPLALLSQKHGIEYILLAFVFPVPAT